MAPINRRLPPPTRRRALELLAGAGEEGCSEAVLLANGFTVDELVDLVRRDLATATPQPIITARGRYEIPMLRITDAGRRVLEGDQDVSRNNREPDAPYRFIAPPVGAEATDPHGSVEKRAGSANVELDEILKARPDLKGKTLEAAKRILRRERRLSLKPRRT